MKRITAILLAVLVLGLTACAPQVDDAGVTTTTTVEQITTTATVTTTIPKSTTTTKKPTTASTTAATTTSTTAATKTTTTTTGGTTMIEQTTATTATADETAKPSLKILAIGNSFSEDAMQHLGEILVGEGYRDIVLGNLYIGGCSLDMHMNNAQSGARAYTFYLNTGRKWNGGASTLEYGVTYTDWDVITMQQVSGLSGMPDSYGNLQPLLDYVRKNAKNPDVKVYWHMTWAYQSGSTHGDFAKYDNDQRVMYDAIVDTVKAKILINDDIDGVIPCGTAIQNLRGSYIGDILTRDGYHLSKDIGRYAAALTWYKQLTGADLTDLTVIPQAHPLLKVYLRVIKEAVNGAVEQPFSVTEVN